MRAFLKLFHGRKTITEEMDDWGVDGPIFEFDPGDFFHVTYNDNICISVDKEEINLNFINGLIYYDNMFYGDYSIFFVDDNDTDTLNNIKHMIEKFDKNKTTQ